MSKSGLVLPDLLKKVSQSCNDAMFLSHNTGFKRVFLLCDSLCYEQIDCWTLFPDSCSLISSRWLLGHAQRLRNLAKFTNNEEIFRLNLDKSSKMIIFVFLATCEQQLLRRLESKTKPP